MKRMSLRTPITVIVTLVMGFMLLPILADARPSDGVKQGSGHPMPTRHHPEHWYGAQHVGDVTAYCIDLNSGPPREASSWTEYTNYTLFKQTGWGGPRGAHGNGPNKTLVGQLAELSWILHETGPAPSPDVAAAVEHAVRVRTIDGTQQESKEAERWGAVSAAHPGVVSEFNRLQREAAQFAGPYQLEVAWAKRPDAGDPRGQFRVTVMSASGRPVPNRPVTVIPAGGLSVTDADASTGPDGIAQVHIQLEQPFDQAVTGSVSVQVASIPGAIPRLFVPAEKTIQRMIAAPHPVTLEWSHQVRLDPVPWTPSVTTRTRDVIAEPGSQAVDIIMLEGGKPGGSFTGTTTLYGPFATMAELTAADPESAPVVGTATFEGVWDAAGNAEVHSTPLQFGEIGYYSWRERLAPSALVVPPPLPSWPQTPETSVVIAPSVTTQLQVVGEPEPGVEVSDSLKLTGVPTDRTVPGSEEILRITASGELLGPMPAQEVDGQPRCDAVAWSKAPVVTRYEDEEVLGDQLSGLLPSILQLPGCYTASATVRVHHAGAVVAEFEHPPGLPSQSVHVGETPPPPATPPPATPPPTETPPPAETPPPTEPSPTPTPSPPPEPTAPPLTEPPSEPQTPRINSGAPLSEVRWRLVLLGLVLASGSVTATAWARSHGS